MIRPELAENLTTEIDGPGPSFTLVTGPSGSGKSHLLGSVLAHRDAVAYRALPLPDSGHRRLLGVRVGARMDGSAAPAPDADWPELLEAVVADVERRRRPLVLALDDAHRLVESRARFPALLADAWSRIRARTLPVHLVLAGRSPELPGSLGGPEGPLLPSVTLRLSVEPLDYRGVGALVPSYDVADRIRTYAVFGGLPSRLRHLDPSVTLATNVQKAVLAPGAPLRFEGLGALAPDVQSPARYVGILGAMAVGRREWGSILAALPDLESGAKMAPYLARLESLGLVERERSLDAAPRSRRRRYHIVDPFLAFWTGLLVPILSDLSIGPVGEAWTRVRAGLDEHTARIFPSVCKAYLARHAGSTLGTTAREVGGLWGSGYDLEPAGTLRNGAVFFGRVDWSPRATEAAAVDGLAGQLRQTRYGFGREGRLRLVFAGSGFTEAARRRAARDHLVHLVEPEHLFA